jgi:hypothetical protein
MKFYLFITLTCVFFVVTCTPDSLQRFPVGSKRGMGGGGRFILIYSNTVLMFHITYRFSAINQLEFLTLKSVYTDNSVMSVCTKHSFDPERNGKYIDGESTSW